MEQQLIGTTSNFGESDYGSRLSYEKPVYRDVVFGILYYAQLLLVVTVAVYLWIVKYPDAKNDGWSSDLNLTGIFVTIFCCAFTGVIFGIFWMAILKRFAMQIIKFMLFFNIACWVFIAILGFAIGSLPLIVIGIILALIYSLWTWCIWRRIPFASVLLSISSQIVSTYGGTICLSLSVIVLNIIWIVIWVSCVGAYAMVENNPSSGMIFLLLISLYWGLQVNQNISHTTTCGVAATWFFTTSINHKPTPAAFKRTMTTSFGSICLGSLIVAFLQAIRAMLRASQRGNNCLRMIAICLIGCIERLIRWFNKYAYAQCAIYGTSFITSAKATWSLFKSRGIMALINDDLSGMAIFCGALIGGCVSAGVGYGLGYAFYGNNDDYNSDVQSVVPVALASYGFIIGLVLCYCVLIVVHSGVIALFVCYAEDPASLFNNRPEEYNRLKNASPSFGNVYTIYANRGGGGGHQNAAPQQPAAANNTGNGYNDGDMYNQSVAAAPARPQYTYAAQQNANAPPPYNPNVNNNTDYHAAI